MAEQAECLGQGRMVRRAGEVQTKNDPSPKGQNAPGRQVGRGQRNLGAHGLAVERDLDWCGDRDELQSGFTSNQYQARLPAEVWIREPFGRVRMEQEDR